MNYYDRINYDPDTGVFTWAASAPGMQREAMLSICVRFRRQVPAEVVELARRLRGEV